MLGPSAAETGSLDAGSLDAGSLASGSAASQPPPPGTDGQHLLWSELGWALRHPRPWVEGLVLNLALSLLYLGWDPIRHNRRASWVILIGTYFATFVLADVTTTNILGHDRIRMRRSLAAGVKIHTLLLRKNFVLLMLVGLPTLMATALLTLSSDDTYILAYTLPGVAFPILTWIGVGNVVSVLLPVAYVPLRVRWRLRYRRRWIGRWLGHLALPYALLYAVEPLEGWPLRVIRHISRITGHHPDARGAMIWLMGIVMWLGCTALSSILVAKRGLSIR